MTEYFQPVKIPAQDDPCTVDQVRLLRQNNHYIRSAWRNLIFSAAWDDGVTTGNVLGDGGVGPDVIYPKGMTSIIVGVIVENSSGASYDASFTFEFLDTTGIIEYTSTETIGTGVQYLSIEIPLDDYGNTFTSDYKEAGIGFTCTGTGVNTTYLYYIGFWGKMDEEQTVDPQLYEVASNLHLRVPAAELSALNTVPQFLGGWMHTGQGDDIVRDASAATPESFRLYHLLDYADDQLSEDKEYKASIAKYGKTTASETFGVKLKHLESAVDNTEVVSVYSADVVRRSVSDVTGESWSTAATESVITADVYSTGGSSDDSALMSIAFTSWDSTPYSTARTQGANRTACDSAYFDATADSTIDYETINGIGLAQFNSMFKRSGQTQAIMFREGKDFNLTTSPVDFWRFAHYIGAGNPFWFTNKRSRGLLRGNVCIVASLSSGTETVEINLSSLGAADSDTVGFALSAGINYVSQQFELDSDTYTGDIEIITSTINTKASPATVKIYAVWIGISSIADTY